MTFKWNENQMTKVCVRVGDLHTDIRNVFNPVLAANRSTTLGGLASLVLHRNGEINVEVRDTAFATMAVVGHLHTNVTDTLVRYRRSANKAGESVKDIYVELGEGGQSGSRYPFDDPRQNERTKPPIGVDIGPKIPPPDFHRLNTGLPSDHIKDPYVPPDHPITDIADLILLGGDTVVTMAVEKIFALAGFPNFFETLGKLLIGDWEAVGEVGHAYGQVAAFQRSLSAHLYQSAAVLFTSWDGTAADVAASYFSRIVALLNQSADGITQVAWAFDRVSWGSYALLKEVEGLLDTLLGCVSDWLPLMLAVLRGDVQDPAHLAKQLVAMAAGVAQACVPIVALVVLIARLVRDRVALLAILSGQLVDYRNQFPVVD